MEIDYSHTQLPDDELFELMENRRQEAQDDATKDKARWAKARSFRFVGGTL